MEDLTWKERVAIGDKLKADHKLEMETRNNLVGHPKADKLYALAWDYGHSSGFNEVRYYYDDLSELLK